MLGTIEGNRWGLEEGDGVAGGDGESDGRTGDLCLGNGEEGVNGTRGEDIERFLRGLPSRIVVDA
jgi:hypothetical protein